MSSWALGVFGLAAAGFLYGWFRDRRPRTAPGRGWTGRILLAVVCFPVALLMLAKLFGSDTLGWMFGLSLMAGVALVPCGVVFLLGYLLASMFRHRADDESA
jgi:hypothetical protein